MYKYKVTREVCGELLLVWSVHLPWCWHLFWNCLFYNVFMLNPMEFQISLCMISLEYYTAGRAPKISMRSHVCDAYTMCTYYEYWNDISIYTFAVKFKLKLSGSSIWLSLSSTYPVIWVQLALVEWGTYPVKATTKWLLHWKFLRAEWPPASWKWKMFWNNHNSFQTEQGLRKMVLTR